MPELPEVETVKKTLEKEILGAILLKPTIYYSPLIKTDLAEYQKEIVGTQIIALSRRGKFLMIHLNNNHQLLFHLRMEGKLFVVDQDEHSTKHLSLFIPFKNSHKGLAFYDTRKFGVSYYLKEGAPSPIDKLGPEPFDIEDSVYLKEKYNHFKKPIKELLLDQTIMSGLGNIYADEVLFASQISPFKKGENITSVEADKILTESKRILNLAILNQGSTVKSYKAAENVHGNFQNFLQVYSREGKICQHCHKFKIQKTKLNGRGTSFCPKCQHTGISIGITGKIATGKSLVTSYFREFGYVTFSADEEVKNLYKSETFLSILKTKFPQLFTPELNKNILSSLLLEDKTFRIRYQNFLYPIIKEKAREFLIKNDGLNKALEIPLLFESKIDKEMTFLLGTESSYQKEHLKERGEKNIEEKLLFNDLNSYDKYRHRLDFIIKTDFDKEKLYQEVKKIVTLVESEISSS